MTAAETQRADRPCEVVAVLDTVAIKVDEQRWGVDAEHGDEASQRLRHRELQQRQHLAHGEHLDASIPQNASDSTPVAKFSGAHGRYSLPRLTVRSPAGHDAKTTPCHTLHKELEVVVPTFAKPGRG